MRTVVALFDLVLAFGWAHEAFVSTHAWYALFAFAVCFWGAWYALRQTETDDDIPTAIAKEQP